jgi:hypothetical protein
MVKNIFMIHSSLVVLKLILTKYRHQDSNKYQDIAIKHTPYF